MARYRKIDTRLWSDERFLKLSPIPPCGQGLWIYLLSGPQTGIIPGLFRAGPAAMAEDLGWNTEDLMEAFREVLQQGLAEADFLARVIWVPKAILYNPPASPNVVTSWAKALDEIPQCTLKTKAVSVLSSELARLGEAFLKPFVKSLSKTMPNQEQEQEQKTGAVTGTGTENRSSNSEKVKTLMSGKPDGVAVDNFPAEQKKINGQKVAKRKNGSGEHAEIVQAVIDHLNQKTLSRFTTAEANAKFIRARIAEGATLELLCAVIDRKAAEWMDHSKMRQFLRPATLFNAEKFNQYAGQLGMKTEADEWAEVMGTSNHEIEINAEVIRHD